MLSKLTRHLRSAHVDDRAIAWGMLSVTAFFLLGSVARAAKEMTIAYKYGVSADVDAYLFVFNLVNWPISVWFSVLTVVLVPLAARIKLLAPEDIPEFRSELLGLTLLAGLLLGLVITLGLPLALRSSVISLPSSMIFNALDVVTPMAILAPLGFLSCLFSAWMMASGRHANTLFESVPPIVIVAALFAFPSHNTQPLVWGTIMGFAAHLATLTMSLAQKRELGIPSFRRESQQWTPFWRGFGIMLGGQVLMSLTTIIDQFFAARLGTGNIAVLNYANRILLLLLGMGAMAVSRATLPVFSQQSKSEAKHFGSLVFRWAALMFALGVITMVFSWLFAPIIVKLLFEHGAFTSQDSTAVTDILRYSLLQIPFYFSAIVFVSYFSSQRQYVLLFWSGVIAIFTKSIGNFIFVPIIQLNGIPLATAAMYIVNFIFFIVIFIKLQKIKHH